MFLTGQKIPEEITSLPEDIMAEALMKIGLKHSDSKKLVKNLKWAATEGQQIIMDAANVLRKGFHITEKNI